MNRMGLEFNKKLLFENIYYLLKTKNLKIGELESAAGVSPGYISRISKEDSTTRPSIEFVLGVSRVLKTSVDALLSVNYAGLSPTEKYIYDFLEKLMNDTLAGELCWEKESLGALADVEGCSNGSTSHPLFVYQDAVKYNSYFAATEGTKPAGEFYHSTLPDGTMVYVTSVRYHNLQRTDYEVYFVQPRNYGQSENVEPVCSSNPKQESPFDQALERLYGVITDACRNVKVSNTARSIIDRFMNGNYMPWEDDNAQLPF